MGQYFAELLNFLPDELIVIVVSMLPIIELRGAIPVGILLGLDPVYSAVLSFIGSSLPAPFILLGIKPIFEFMKRHGILTKLIDKLTARSLRKSGRVEKYGALGLSLFVGIPLPGTGVWSGSLIAALLDMRFKYALPAVIIGNLIAGIIILITSYGVLALI